MAGLRKRKKSGGGEKKVITNPPEFSVPFIYCCSGRQGISRGVRPVSGTSKEVKACIQVVLKSPELAKTQEKGGKNFHFLDKQRAKRRRDRETSCWLPQVQLLFLPLEKFNLSITPLAPSRIF